MDFTRAINRLAQINESFNGSNYWRIVIDEYWSGHVIDQEGTTIFEFGSLRRLINELDRKFKQLPK